MQDFSIKRVFYGVWIGLVLLVLVKVVLHV